MINRCTIDTPNTHTQDRSFSWLGTDTLIKDGGIKLVLCAQNNIIQGISSKYMKKNIVGIFIFFYKK
jgi:hypothetical protein